MVTASEVENYLITFENILFYLPGDYKITFYAKSNNRTIPIGVSTKGEVQVSKRDNFTLDPIKILDDTTITEPVSLENVGIFLDFDKEVFVYPVYLFLEIETNSNNEKKYTGKILLSRRKTLLDDEKRYEEPGYEEKHDGTIHFYNELEVESIRVNVGCIKYTLSRIVEKLSEDISSPINEEDKQLKAQNLQLDILKETDEDKVEPDIIERNQKEESNNDIPPPNYQHKVEEPINRTILHKEDLLNIDCETHEVLLHVNEHEKSKSSKIIESEPLKLPKKKTHAISDFNIDFPDVNAIKQILPKYHSLKNDDRRRTSIVSHVPIKEPENLSTPKVTEILRTSTPERLSLSPQTKESLDSHVLAVLDYQAKELDRYRNVIQKMGSDIITLRQEISDLEHSKSQILSKFYYAGEGLGDGSDDEVVLLRRQLMAQEAERTSLLERINNLQNEMIRKNEVEESYLQLQKAHEAQQNFVQASQSKLEKYAFLHETIKKQEKVIEKLEEKINAMQMNKVQGVTLSPKKKSLNSSTIKNQIHRDEPANRNEMIDLGVTQKVYKISSANPNIANQACAGCQKVPNNFDLNSVDERISMMQKIQQAELKIQTLEEQLQRNAVEWVKERSNLQNGYRNPYMINNNNQSSYLPNNFNNGHYQLSSFPQRWSNSWHAP